MLESEPQTSLARSNARSRHPEPRKRRGISRRHRVHSTTVKRSTAGAFGRHSALAVKHKACSRAVTRLKCRTNRSATSAIAPQASANSTSANEDATSVSSPAAKLGSHGISPDPAFATTRIAASQQLATNSEAPRTGSGAGVPATQNAIRPPSTTLGEKTS